MCKYRVNRHLIILNLCNVSINEILITEFIFVQVSQYLNLMYVNKGEGGRRTVLQNTKILITFSKNTALP